MNIFNRQLLKQNRNRCSKKFHNHDFLIKEIGRRIIEQISDFTPNSNFSSILEIGARDGFLGQELAKTIKPNLLVQTDCSFKIIADSNYNLKPTNKVIADDEFLCFKDNSFDLIISNLNLHYINQIERFLLKIKNLLKKNGLFIASFLGQNTLQELRQVFYQAEIVNYQGISPRIAPFIDIKDAGMLLQKAGFINPVADLDSIEITYPSVIKLMFDLKNSGGANILFKRSRKFMTRKILADLEKTYFELYGIKDENDNPLIKANFDIITLTAWKANN